MIALIKILLFLLVNISFITFFKKISHTFNLYDYPNLERKKHLKPVSLLGGFIFFINFDLFIFFDIYTNNKFFLEFDENPSHLSLLSYDLVGLVYYLSIKTNLSKLNKLFKKKNSFKGKIGIFDIKNNKINHKLNFYKIENKQLIEIF